MKPLVAVTAALLAAAAAGKRDPLKPSPSQDGYLLAQKYILARDRTDDGMKVLARYLAQRPDDWEGLYLQAAGFVRQGRSDQALAALVKAFKAGLPVERVLTSASEHLGTFVETPEVKKLLAARAKPLLHGPMLGRVTTRSASLWVRTRGEQAVEVRVSPAGARASATTIRSRPVRTRKDWDFTAVVTVTGLKPWTRYEYDVLVAGRSMLSTSRPAFRTFPARGQKVKFQVGFGGGARYVPARESMWSTIAGVHPLAFLFLGDNVYIDAPGKPDVQRAHYYRRQSRPEFRRLTASSAIYAIYDDHDFGRNDTKGGRDPDKPAWKRQSLKVFAENWANPSYGGGDAHPGCWFQVSIGDVDVWMLDQRYYWDVKAGSILGPAQKKWLLDSLAASTATFKVLAAGTLWTEHADKKGADSWESVRAEREAIFDLIRTRRIGGVILLSADRHRTEVWKIQREGLYPLYEFESSKLTNIHTHGGNKHKTLFTRSKGNFFGLLTFDTTPADPTVTFQVVDVGGKVLHTHRIALSEISFRKKGAAK